MADTDLSLLLRQQKQLLDEMATMRDDMAVMAAILQRIDGTLAGLVTEIRATHARHTRLERRVRALEPALPDGTEV